MKSIDGVFTWADFFMHRLFTQWKNEGNYPRGFYYCKSQPRLSYIEPFDRVYTLDNGDIQEQNVGV